MRPWLTLLPAFLWLRIVQRYAQTHTMHGPVVASDAGGGVGIIFPQTKEAGNVR